VSILSTQSAASEPGRNHDRNHDQSPRARRSRASSPAFLQQHPWWSAFRDKRYDVWRVAEDDPDSALYAESADAAEVLSYMTAHS
jgi:hypothetical protein